MPKNEKKWRGWMNKIPKENMARLAEIFSHLPIEIILFILYFVLPI
jgi:hypothetical protein